MGLGCNSPILCISSHKTVSRSSMRQIPVRSPRKMYLGLQSKAIIICILTREELKVLLSKCVQEWNCNSYPQLGLHKSWPGLGVSEKYHKALLHHSLLGGRGGLGQCAVMCWHSHTIVNGVIGKLCWPKLVRIAPWVVGYTKLGRECSALGTTMLGSFIPGNPRRAGKDSWLKFGKAREAKVFWSRKNRKFSVKQLMFIRRLSLLLGLWDHIMAVFSVSSKELTK